MEIYVGNLAQGIKNTDLEKLFSAHGKVVSVAVARDRRSGESRGFAFVEMGSRGEGERAIAALHDTEFWGQKLRVNEARERQEQEGRGGPGRQRDSDRGQHSSRQHFRGGWEHGARGAHTNRGQGGKRGS